MKRGIKYIEHKGGRVQKVRIRRLTNMPGLGIARGAGSIFAEAEVIALARAERFTEAADMGDEHDRDNPKSKLRMFGPAVRKMWRQEAAEGVTS